MERLDTYCKQLGVEHPEVFWTKKAFKERYPGQRVVMRHRLGLCWRMKGAILVVYNKHNGLRHLDYTLRHELVHWRFPQVKHGARFEKLIKQIKDGVCWEPFTDADFEAYRQKRIRKLTMNRLFPKNRITPSEDPFATKEDTLIYTEGGSNNNV